MEVKYVKSHIFSYLHRIHIAAFLPFRAYNTDNQLIIHSLTKKFVLSMIIRFFVASIKTFTKTIQNESISIFSDIHNQHALLL